MSERLRQIQEDQERLEQERRRQQEAIRQEQARLEEERRRQEQLQHQRQEQYQKQARLPAIEEGWGQKPRQKVVASVWGAKFFQFLAELVVLPLSI